VEAHEPFVVCPGCKEHINPPVWTAEGSPPPLCADCLEVITKTINQDPLYRRRLRQLLESFGMHFSLAAVAIPDDRELVGAHGRRSPPPPPPPPRPISVGPNGHRADPSGRRPRNGTRRLRLAVAGCVVGLPTGMLVSEIVSRALS
jgi:hypothetical protein